MDDFGETIAPADMGDGAVASFEQKLHLQLGSGFIIKDRKGSTQLMRWVYETSNTNITVAERLEKSKLEVAKRQRT